MTPKLPGQHDPHLFATHLFVGIPGKGHTKHGAHHRAERPHTQATLRGKAVPALPTVANSKSSEPAYRPTSSLLPLLSNPRSPRKTK